MQILFAGCPIISNWQSWAIIDHTMFISSLIAACRVFLQQIIRFLWSRTIWRRNVKFTETLSPVLYLFSKQQVFSFLNLNPSLFSQSSAAILIWLWPCRNTETNTSRLCWLQMKYVFFGVLLCFQTVLKLAIKRGFACLTLASFSGVRDSPRLKPG